ncbi:MAG: hypothetical protein HKO89_00775, partial [Saprospiraceae bacterium]|nr:hypothetical protein [Saprospiraceae bacterium]
MDKNHPDKPSQNPVDQLEIGCNFPIIEFYSCPKEFPTNPPIFLDSISNENEDEEYFELIGGSILNPANPVIITVRDTSNVPGTCSDTFWTKRIYTIDDGSETLECYRTFMCLEPPVRLLKHSENIEVSCSENTDSLYNEWISNHGNLEYLACSKPVILLTEPEIPELIYSCPGNAKSEVIFKVKDSCGSWIFSQGTFEVIDSTAPEISCPENIEIKIGDIYNDTLLQNLLDLYVDVAEHCSETIIQSDFLP